MTRKRLTRVLRATTLVIGLILAAAFVARLAPHIPGIATTPAEAFGTALYEYLRDMALLVATIVAAWLAAALQKRASFTERLQQEWRTIVETKTRLMLFCEKTYPSSEDYQEAYAAISMAIDSMRVVYSNVGETKTQIGLYPYEPLHDMRRALSTLDPRSSSKVTAEQRALVCQAIEQSFAAIRESFLDELDLDSPTKPILAPGARRLKQSGAQGHAKTRMKKQLDRFEQIAPANRDVQDFLCDLYYREQGRNHVAAQPVSATTTDRPAAETPPARRKES
jgi:hypothetical protein